MVNRDDVAPMTVAARQALLEAHGWNVARRDGDLIRFTHPRCEQPIVFCCGSPDDILGRLAVANVLMVMKQDVSDVP